MKQLLPSQNQSLSRLKGIILSFLMLISMQSFANETDCGHISGFEFSNGNSSISIIDGGSYVLNQLPNNFYIDVIVSGQSESASIQVENLDSGQAITVGENYLPYTNPAGNGAWSYGTGTFEVDAKIFKYNYCNGSYCDREKVTFTITNTSSCGQIDGLEFSNGSNSVAVVDGGSYDIASLPNNFYVDIKASGITESAFNKVTNLDTGAVYTNGENVLPYTYPSGNQAWTLGAGTFKFDSSVFKYDGCTGDKCDSISYIFTLYEDNCGEISEFEFSNGNSTITIVDGASYDINNLPANFYLDAIVSGESESLRFEVQNLDTGEAYNIIENYLPYTFPAGNGAWFLGAGTFEVKASLFSGNYCNSTLCDEEVITFTVLEEDCGQIDGFEFSNFSSDPTVTIIDGASYDLNNIPSNFNINVLTSGAIESVFNTLTNLDTGAVYTKLENAVPYTFPGATNQVWTLGCGTFKLCASAYNDNNTNGTECENACITFTLTGCTDPCGQIDEFEFSNGTDTIDITDGGTFDINSLPSGFYVDAIVSGLGESVRLSVKNLDTNEEYSIIENFVPYTFPAGNGAWFLGTGTFQIKAELFSGNYCNYTKCDEQIITFTLTDEVITACLVELGTYNTDVGAVIVSATNTGRINIAIDNDGGTIIPEGFSTGVVVTQTDALTITDFSTELYADFSVAGDYKMHLLIYDENTLDLSSIQFGLTSAFDILNTIEANEICAALDELGIPILAIQGGVDQKVSTTDEIVIITSTDDDETIEEEVKEETVLNVKTSQVPSADIKLYPNPVVNNLNIELLLLDAEVMNYNMLDLNGRQVLSGSFDNSSFGKTQVNTSKLTNGLYIITFESNFRSFSKKVQVNH